jgi:hypothetical protein
MLVQTMREAFSDLGHSYSMIAERTNARQDDSQDNLKGLASIYQVIGIATIVASTVFGFSGITTAISISSLAAVSFNLLALIPLLVGIELFLMGTSAKEIKTVSGSKDDALLRIDRAFNGNESVEKKFSVIITKNTLFMKYFSDEITWLTNPLYQTYCDA